MSSIDRPLKGTSLRYDLEEEIERTGAPASLESGGRAARTLVKDGPLRVTLVVLGPDAGMDEHTAPGPVTLHLIRGVMKVQLGEETTELASGQILSIGPGAPHAVSTTEGAVFLLTIVHPPAAEDE